MSREGGTKAEGPSLDWREFTHRVWVAVGVLAVVAGGVLLLWLASTVALLFFASVLLAIFLRSLSDWVGRRLHTGVVWSLTIVVASLLALAGLIGWLLAAPVSHEVAQLSDELPKALNQLQEQLQRTSWGQTMLESLQRPTGLLGQAGSFLKNAKSFFSITIESVIYFWVVLFSGFYLTTEPDLYIRGFLLLVPSDKRERAKTILGQIGDELRSWLFGQIISMAIIGLLTWAGLRLLGVPLAEGLGVLAGILDFVPVVGPWVAGVISCLLALLKSPMHAVYVACLFIGLHLFEGHILVPQVQKRSTRLPPVLTILAMVLFQMLFGFLGLFLATPLLALLLVAIKALYVQDVLGKRGINPRAVGDSP